MAKLSMNHAYGERTITKRGDRIHAALPMGLPHIKRWTELAGPRCLRPVHRMTLRCLGIHANAAGIVWPSQETIANYVGATSTATVRSALLDLQAVGMIAISVRPPTEDDRSEPHQLQYRLDGADCDWQPFDYGDSGGMTTIAALVAKQRDELQVEVELLRLETEHLRARLSKYEEIEGTSGSGGTPPQSEGDDPASTANVQDLQGKSSSRDIPPQSEGDDPPSPTTTTKANVQNLQVGIDEIEEYLSEHWSCIGASQDNPRGFRTMGGALHHYANDLEKFERDRRMHLREHEAAGRTAEPGEEDPPGAGESKYERMIREQQERKDR